MSQYRLAVWGAAAALMLLPLGAIRAVEGETWNLPGDAVFLAVLWIGVGLAYELAARSVERRPYSLGLGMALGSAILCTWINLAVGIIGSEDNPANLLYVGVLLVGVVGTLMARFRPRGMAVAMIATAIAQALVFFGALIAGLGFTGPITVFFGALWLISAWLFHSAAKQQRGIGRAG